MRATIRALSEQRWTVIAFAVAAFAITLLQSVAYFRLAGHTFAERAAFGYSLLLEAVDNAALLPPPVHPETAGGYLELRAFEPLAILFAAWATVSATASSSREPVARAAAFATAVVVAAAAACVGVMVGLSSGGESIIALRLAEAGLLLVAIAIACYGISLVFAQISPAPTVVAGSLMLILFFLNSLSRVFTQLGALRWLSPFRYYDLSTPLPPGGNFDVGGFLVLLAIASLGVAVASFGPIRRGGSKTQPRPLQTWRLRLLAFPVARTIYPQRTALAAWCLSFAALGFVLAFADRTSMQDVLALPRGLPGLPQYIFVFYAQLLDETWIDVTMLMIVSLVFSFVIGWADDDRFGRLEATLSSPYSRSEVVLERLGSLASTTALLVALGGLAVAVTSNLLNLEFDSARFVAACVLLLLFGLVLGGAGSLLTSWLPRAAPILFGAAVLASYLADQIGAALRLPAWAQDISPFRLVGAALARAVDGRSVALLLLLAVACIGSSIFLMQRRDVGTPATYQKQ